MNGECRVRWVRRKCRFIGEETEVEEEYTLERFLDSPTPRRIVRGYGECRHMDECLEKLEGDHRRCRLVEGEEDPFFEPTKKG